jgi:hypothetical protein
VSEDANSRFLDVMEDYFDQDEEALKADARPEYHFQVGVTLENTEKVSCRMGFLGAGLVRSLTPLFLLSPNATLPILAKPSSPPSIPLSDLSTLKAARLTPSVGESELLPRPRCES